MKTRGVLLYAFNNERIDYLRLANFCAWKVKTVWGLPTTVVTNVVQNKGFNFRSCHFDKVVHVGDSLSSGSRDYLDYSETLSFHNGNRCFADVYTPYDQTILIDSDFVVNTPIVPMLWTTEALKISCSAHDVTGKELPMELVRLNARSSKMYWATIVCFDKTTELSAQFFKNWKHAGSHYRIYGDVFGYLDRVFRNDFAVSVALNRLFDGLIPNEVELPYSIPTAFTDTRILSVEPLKLEGAGAMVGDLHVMHKKSLLEAVCQLQAF